ncbi:MAG: WD40/YVTN/BNR-like repeat-containing protein, partial [Flavobacteriales bacterium]
MKKHLLFLALAVVSFNITAQFTSLNGPSVSGECRGLFTNESMTLTSVGENLWRSTDDGLTWELITVDPEENTDPICFAEHNGVIVMGTNDADRVYRSTDNGLTWETANTGMPTIFGFPGAVPQFASVFNGVFYMAGTNHVRRSLDLGLTWDTMDVDGLCYGLGVSDTEVWVSINSGIYASSDDGDTWELRTSPVYAGLVTADPSGYAQIGDRLVCSTTLAAGAGIFYSDDNGSTWTISETPLSVCRDVEVIGDAVYVTANSGLYKSLDQGVTWALAGAGGNARLMSYNDDYLWFGSGSGSIRVDLNTEVVDQMDVPASTPQNIQSNGSVLFALSSGDLFTSPIAGGDWTNVSDNINADGQVVHFYNDGPTLYVVFELNFETFLYESADNGANFT